MGRQVSIKDHCLLCLSDVHARGHASGNAKIVYERNPGGGMLPLAIVCDVCLSSLRGGNWPSDVYAKLYRDRRVEGERAVEALVT